jgi:hypothetical protein
MVTITGARLVRMCVPPHSSDETQYTSAQYERAFELL